MSLWSKGIESSTPVEGLSVLRLSKGSLSSVRTEERWSHDHAGKKLVDVVGACRSGFLCFCFEHKCILCCIVGVFLAYLNFLKNRKQSHQLLLLR